MNCPYSSLAQSYFQLLAEMTGTPARGYFLIPCQGSYESEHTTHSKGCMIQEGRGKDKTVRNMGYTRWTLQGLTGRKAGNLKEVDLGWINGGRKGRGFGWGKIGGGEQLF